MSDGPDRCPCCKQTVRTSEKPQPARICYDCGQPITGHHKWQIVTRNSMSVLVHRVCCNPGSYMRAAQCKKAGVVYYRSMSKERIAELTAIEDAAEARFAEWRKEMGR